MIYGSVCSGIEAATVAWHPLGWKSAFFSEIEKFPRSLLTHHYPDVPLHGDFTTIKEGDYEPIDLLVGGTPCQSFSVAGLRGGLSDERGNLALEYIRLAQRLKPRWVVWENVPGVLSSNGGRDFGTFLGGLGECGYGFAYRVLDAQYFGVPQRRRRVFVVGYLGDWRRAAAVLFERDGLRGDITPRREEGERTAGHVAPCLDASGVGFSRIGDIRGQDPVVAVAGLVTHALRGEGFDASEDGTGRGTPVIAFPATLSATQRVGESNVSQCLKSSSEMAVAIPINMQVAIRHKQLGERTGLGVGQTHDPAFTLGVGHSHAVAYDMRGRENGAQFEGPHDTANLRASSGGSSRSYVAAPLTASYGKQVDSSDSSSGPPNLIQTNMAVRRLTPRECERLQGFPDDYTKISDKTADGPRYKALGNSMAVPVMRWIGERIQMVEDIK